MLIQVNMSEKNNTYYGLRLKGKEMGDFSRKGLYVAGEVTQRPQR